MGDHGGVVRIQAIGGMAGVGKTALAVHAAHQIASQFADGQIFLGSGFTPGQRPVDPADALASLLLTAGVPAQQIPPGLEPRRRLWRDHLAGKHLLLVLDDAAGHEQVRPLLPGTARQPGADYQPSASDRIGGRADHQSRHPPAGRCGRAADQARRPGRSRFRPCRGQRNHAAVRVSSTRDRVARPPDRIITRPGPPSV